MTCSALSFTRPVVVLPGIAVLVAMAGLGAFVVMRMPEAAAHTSPAAQPLPLVKPASASLRERTCNSCGIVETIRRTESATGLPSYQFTVRMRDGSARDSSQATRGRWLEGDRVLVIGGAAVRATEERKNALQRAGAHVCPAGSGLACAAAPTRSRR